LKPYLRIGVRTTEQSTVLRVEGELDLASARQLEQAIAYARRSAPPLLVLDLEKLRFIDMAGLRVMLAAYQEAENEGQQLVLAHVPGRIRRVLALAEVEDLLPEIEGGRGC
jgi:anti-sigma B factor antagonist